MRGVAFKEDTIVEQKFLPSLMLGLIFFILLLTGCGAQAEPSAMPPPAADSPAPLDGQALMQERCTVCHSTERIVQAHKTVEQWATTVARMVGKGANLTAEEQQTLVEYLAQTYP